MALYFLFLILFISYTALIIYYWHGWKTTPVFIPDTKMPSTFVSIIIPARNEANNIDALLKSIFLQTYPKELYEVIVVDDHSTDDTVAVAKKYEGVKVLTFEDAHNSYKKKAIETGIAAAKGTLIVCTDADCIVPPEWLLNLASYSEKHGSVFIAAPVNIRGGFSVPHLFQELDFMMLQGITCASVFKGVHPMSNGANLAYQRNAFYEVNGFRGIDHLASGDDMLLMGRMQKKFPGRIHYLKSTDAIVETSPQATWKELINQRIRWASKATHYAHPATFFVLFLVYIFNLAYLILFIAGFWDPIYWLVMLSGIIMKSIIEFVFFIELAEFFNKKNKLVYVFPLQFIHIPYVIIAGFFGQFRKYTWKGRRVR